MWALAEETCRCPSFHRHPTSRCGRPCAKHRFTCALVLKLHPTVTLMLAFWTEFQKFGRWWKYLRFNLTCSLLIERSFKL